MRDDVVSVGMCGHTFCSGCLLLPALLFVTRELQSPLCPQCNAPIETVERRHTVPARAGRDAKIVRTSTTALPWIGTIKPDSDERQALNACNSARMIPKLRDFADAPAGSYGSEDLVYVLVAARHREKNPDGSPGVLDEHLTVHDSFIDGTAGPIGGRATRTLVELSKLLHVHLTARHAKDRLDPVNNENEMVQRLLSDRSPFHLFIHGLACGGNLPSADANAEEWELSKLIVPWVVAEMLRKLNNPRRVHPLHSFVAGQLDSHRVAGAVNEMLRRVGISTTMGVLLRERDSACTEFHVCCSSWYV